MSDRFDEKSDFLFVRPSFLEGVARIMDFGNTLTQFNRSKNSAEADARAIASDWAVVGKDIKTAMAKFDESEGKTKK